MRVQNDFNLYNKKQNQSYNRNKKVNFEAIRWSTDPAGMHIDVYQKISGHFLEYTAPDLHAINRIPKSVLDQILKSEKLRRLLLTNKEMFLLMTTQRPVIEEINEIARITFELPSDIFQEIAANLERLNMPNYKHARLNLAKNPNSQKAQKIFGEFTEICDKTVRLIEPHINPNWRLTPMPMET